MQDKKKILEYQKKEVYLKDHIIEKENIKGCKKDYYKESLDALIQYMKNHEKNPSENRWDQYVIDKKYLSSKTIGYLSEIGFNTLCRKLRKEINKEKRQIKK